MATRDRIATPRPEDGCPRYDEDLASAALVWGTPGVLRRAGLGVFLTYLTIPELLAVGGPRSPSDQRLPVVTGPEHRFLRTVMGLADTEPAPRGVRDLGTAAWLGSLAARHRALAGMRQEYLDVMAGLLGLLPLRAARPDDATATHYWHYLKLAMELVGARVGSPEESAASCDAFVARHTQPSPQTGPAVLALFAAHPTGIQEAFDVVHPRTREAALTVLGSLSVSDLVKEA